MSSSDLKSDPRLDMDHRDVKQPGEIVVSLGRSGPEPASASNPLPCRSKLEISLNFSFPEQSKHWPAPRVRLLAGSCEDENTCNEFQCYGYIGRVPPSWSPRSLHWPVRPVTRRPRRRHSGQRRWSRSPLATVKRAPPSIQPVRKAAVSTDQPSIELVVRKTQRPA